MSESRRIAMHGQTGLLLSTSSFSIALAMVSASQPFFWARLPVINLALPTFVAIAFIGLGFFYPKRMLDSTVSFYHAAFWFHTTLLLYIASLCISTIASSQIKTAFPVLSASILGTCCYFGIGARLFGFQLESIKNSILYGLVCGMACLLIYSHYVFSSMGQSLIEGVQQAINSGTSQIGARLMKAIVNYNGGETASDGDSEISGAVRNTLAACLSFFFFFSVGCILPSRRNRIRSALAILAVVTCPLLTLLLASRSNLISIAIGSAVLLAVALYYNSSQVILKNALILLLLTGAALATSVAINAEWINDNALVAANLERLSNVQEDSRLENYRLALQESLHSPYFGKGPGAHVSDGLTVHNLVLGAWFEAGVFGLLSSLAMYLCLVWLWQRRALSISGKRLHLSFNSILLQASAAAMLTGPVIRRMISGNGGRFAFVELLAIAVFIALTRNFDSEKKEQSETLEPSQ